MQEQMGRVSQRHILTIALEDYFHGPAFSKIISQTRWGRFETRFEQNCLTVLEKLQLTHSQATFFVNAWVARSCPHLLREVVLQGHEIALAGQRNVSFRLLSRSALREQVRRDRDLVEQACQRRVIGYRVSDVFLRPRDLWGFEVLAEEGFRYDSSLSPFLRAFAAEPWRQYIHHNDLPSGPFWEVPLSSHQIAGLMFPVAGGNYFRQFPEWLVKSMIARWNERRDHPLVLYFRLWDFDPLQPRLQTGSFWQQFRHYRNAERMVATLTHLLAQLRFGSISKHLGLEVSPVSAAPQPDYSAFSSARQQTGKKQIPVSIIVPCFNEESGIPYLARTLRELKEWLSDEYEVEFILVDDGSTDQTWRLLEQYFSARPDTQLIHHPQNLGIAAAIRTGISHSREIVCSMDCDCSYDPSELKPMLSLLTPSVDLVTASPYHPAGSVLNVPQWRLLLSRQASALYRLVTGRKIYTFTSCVRVYRRSAVLDVPLRNSCFLGIAELLSRLALRDKGIVEHPATLEVRIFGQSKMKVARNILGHLRLLSQLAAIRIRHPRAQNDARWQRVVTPQQAKQSGIVTEIEL